MAISFSADIVPLFRSKDLSCMGGLGVTLDDFAYMADPAGDHEFSDHANARRVYCHLQPDGCAPRMPPRGPFWSDEQLARFNRWMLDGFNP